MITQKTLRTTALSLPETTEEPHFEKTSFRVRKKIFATYDARTNRATLKLSENDQDIFTRISEGAIYPVANKWGKQGWTIAELSQIKKDVLKEALVSAYCTVAPRALAIRVRPEIFGT